MTQETMAPNGGGFVHALTGLRFLAAAHVVVFHFGHGMVGDGPAWLKRLVDAGWAGVGFFFVLSGFVLGMNAFARESTPRQFYLHRFARIYPLYLLSLLLLVPMLVAHVTTGDGSAGKTLLQSLLALTLLQAWIPGWHSVVNFPAWSLSVEASLYVAFPSLMRRIRNFRTRGFALAALVFWGLSASLPLLYVVLDPDGIGSRISPHHYQGWIEYLKFNPLSGLFAFACGVAFAGLHERARRNPAHPLARHAVELSYLGVLAWVGIILGLYGLPYLFPFLHNSLLIPVYGAIILGLALSRGSWLNALLGNRVMRILGEASFGVYILQSPVRDLFLRIPVLRELMGGWSFPIYFAGLCLVSAALHYAFERPMRSIVLNIRGRALHGRDCGADNTRCDSGWKPSCQ